MHIIIIIIISVIIIVILIIMIMIMIMMMMMINKAPARQKPAARSLPAETIPSKIC